MRPVECCGHPSAEGVRECLGIALGVLGSASGGLGGLGRLSIAILPVDVVVVGIGVVVVVVVVVVILYSTYQRLHMEKGISTTHSTFKRCTHRYTRTQSNTLTQSFSLFLSSSPSHIHKHTSEHDSHTTHKGRPGIQPSRYEVGKFTWRPDRKEELVGVVRKPGVAVFWKRTRMQRN